MWLYGTGMPKSRRLPGGRGTTLKPAYEPILLARRPPEEPIARTVQRHGTGVLNIDHCRIEGPLPGQRHLLSLARLPRRTLRERLRRRTHRRRDDSWSIPIRGSGIHAAEPALFCAKVSRREGDAGCERLPRRTLDLFPNAQDGGGASPARNPHPTVKPLALMRWLVRLATPEHGLVLDPFCGSGSTGAAAALEGRRFLGIELDADYAVIARTRIAHWAGRRARSEAT